MVKNQRIVVTRLGGPDCLRLIDDEAGEPAEGEVRIRVLTAGVSFADLLMREGRHPERKSPPFTPGWDLVGEIDCVGGGVKEFTQGDRVAALTIIGSYTRFICLPAKELVTVPAGVDPVEAVCLVMDYVVAYQMLHRSVTLNAGDTVLIHGAAGGCGTALLQLGRLMQLEMLGTVSAGKADQVRDFGAIPIDYRAEDFVKVARAKSGAKVVFDSVGGRNLLRSYRCLQRGGTVVFYGMTTALRNGRRNWRGTCATIFYLLAAYATNLIPDGRRVTVYSIQNRKRKHPDEYQTDLSTLLHKLAERAIIPVIANQFPLEEAAQAHRVMTHKKRSGKVVLVCTGQSR